jgi:hypothetical protein
VPLARIHPGALVVAARPGRPAALPAIAGPPAAVTVGVGRVPVVPVSLVVRLEVIAAVVGTGSSPAVLADVAAAGWHPDGVARVLPAVVVLVPAIPAGRPDLRIVVFIAPPKPDAEKDGDEDHDDYGDEADYEQDHRTTQQAMAIWVALARPRGHGAGLPLYR